MIKCKFGKQAQVKANKQKSSMQVQVQQLSKYKSRMQV